MLVRISGKTEPNAPNLIFEYPKSAKKCVDEGMLNKAFLNFLPNACMPYLMIFQSFAAPVQHTLLWKILKYCQNLAIKWRRALFNLPFQHISPWYTVIFMILVSLFFSINVFFVHLKMSKYVFWVVARLPQRLKSKFFEIFSSLQCGPIGIAAPLKNFKKRWI